MDVATITAVAAGVAVVLRAVAEVVKAWRVRRAERCEHQLEPEPA